jgi:hypothetical protein
MKKLLTLTLFSLLAISCTRGNGHYTNFSKSSSMTYSAGTQADLDAGNQRINDYRQELLRQGFREVSTFVTHTSGAVSNSKEEFVLEGQYRSLKDLKVTFLTTKLLEKDQPQLRGGVDATINDEQAEQDFEELYKKVSFVVTGHAH